MSVVPYEDQIYKKSLDRSPYRSDVRRLVSTFSSPSRLITVGDAVADEEFTTYKTIVTDNILPIDYIQLSPEFWGVYSYQSDYINRIPTKLFNCFMHRACSRRQTWFYEFVRKNLLDHGSVSFLLDHRVHKCSTIIEKQELFERIYKEECGEDFIVEHNQIKSQVPYRNFDGDLDQTIVDSKISIVIETYFMGKAIAFSEKIFRALQLPRPMLMYNVPNSVSALRDIGFDMYDDIVNHEYDNIDHPENRMAKILSILEDFKNFNYNNDTLIDFEQRAQCNRNLLTLFREKWPEKLKIIEKQLSQNTI